uniref:Uncharacterized protein n=1 Tax=Daucus carota subsp. sativus TaxID=79200 RepID=A0A166AE90_DAUCS
MTLSNIHVVHALAGTNHYLHAWKLVENFSGERSGTHNHKGLDGLRKRREFRVIGFEKE